VLGELEVWRSGGKAELPTSRRARALLGWLAVHPGGHHRSRLAGLFWPEVLDASARASLRSAIWALRPALGACLATNRDTIALAGAELWVDVREFRQLIRDGQPGPALALCRGDLLQELDDDWVASAREDLENDMAAALGHLTGQATATGDLAAALTWARRLTSLRPLDESAGGALIRALIDTGDEPAALEAFGKLRQRLSAELGIAPSAATKALVEPLRTSLPPHAPPSVSLADDPASAGPGAGTGSWPTAGLIGRDRQFAELMRAWHAAAAGTGTTVVLDGEGGIGKTRLVQELRAAAVQTNDRCLAVIADTVLAHAAPFAIWTTALSELVSLIGQPPEGEIWAADLARIVPALAYQAPGLGGDPQLDRVRLCEAVVQFLAWASSRAPVLLAFEDLHMADTASVELIAYAGRRLSRLPVVFVLTRRELPARQQLDAVLGALRSRRALGAEIHLGPLTDDAIRTLVLSMTELPEATVSQVVRLAAGSPLLAVETARAASSGAADLDLTAVVRLAVSRLTVPARMFVEFAAAAGRDLDRAEVTTLPLPNPARDGAEALGSGLLAATGDGRIGFRHALLRDAVYQAIPDPVRARLHGEFAQLLRKRGKGRTRAAEIAHHLRLAGQDEQAVSQLALAAQDARRVAAMAEAAVFLTEALLVERDNTELLVELAEVEAFRALLSSSDQAFSRALEQIAPQDSGALISAWLRRGRWLRGGICHPRESRRSYQSALDVLDREPADDLPARAEALAGMAWAEAVAGDPAEVNKLLAEVERILGGAMPGRGSHGDLLAHDIGVARGHALIRVGQFTESFGPLIAASTAAGRAGRPDMAYSCLSNAASAAACAGEFGRALDFADRCLSLVTPNGLLRLCVYTQTARSAILRRLDRLAEAERACDAAAAYADRIGLPDLNGLVHAERGLLLLASGDPAAAAGELASALELNAPVSRAATRLRLAEALALAGQPARAETELRAVTLEPVSPSDFPATLVARMSRVQGLVASARGDFPLADRRLAESLAAWQRIAGTLDSRQAGAGYVAALIDLGRPPVSSLVEPARELAVVRADLAAIARS
jgi:DNA-binding SARP family transcriptional activator/tetratricopeptide (TPR) repeat protein